MSLFARATVDNPVSGSTQRQVVPQCWRMMKHPESHWTVLFSQQKSYTCYTGQPSNLARLFLSPQPPQSNALVSSQMPSFTCFSSPHILADTSLIMTNNAVERNKRVRVSEKDYKSGAYPADQPQHTLLRTTTISSSRGDWPPTSHHLSTLHKSRHAFYSRSSLGFGLPRCPLLQSLPLFFTFLPSTCLQALSLTQARTCHAVLNLNNSQTCSRYVLRLRALHRLRPRCCLHSSTIGGG